tara:strand:+ start:443 stop:892 length:450 start_codon:yes stop_codon:yes gene_type:complete
LTVGGSVTIDGGFSILKALGADFFDELGHNVVVNQLAYPRSVAALNLDRLKKNLHQISSKVLVDVEYTLCGNEGAVHIFGPQKGVHSYQLPIFEDLIQHLGDLLTTALNQNIFELKEGAGGGVLAAIVAYHPQTTSYHGASFLINLADI